MRLVQYRLLTRILDHAVIPDYIYAFEKGKSIPSMAETHVGKNLVVSVDIKDFFHSIKQRQLLEVFLNSGFCSSAARTISEICTYKAYVPQGALTSPKISNIIAALSFGPILKEFCDSKGLTMTIYADDVTISSDIGTVLNVPELLAFIKATLTSFNFRVNHDKTKVMHRGCRQYVCGVVVNEKTNLAREERQKLRAIIHNITYNGLEAEAAKNSKRSEEFLHHLRGRLNWFKQINPVGAQKLIDRLCDAIQIPNETETLRDDSTFSTIETSCGEDCTKAA